MSAWIAVAGSLPAWWTAWLLLRAVHRHNKATTRSEEPTP